MTAVLVRQDLKSERSAVVRTVHELLRSKALLLALVERHLATRYRGSLLGFLWSLLNPLSLMLVYTLVFHYYMRAPGVEHYSIFLFAGLLPWLWTVSALNESTTSIVSSGHLITKSMFPAQILPTVAVLSALVNFLLSLSLYFAFAIWEGVAISWTVLLLPLAIFVHGLALWGWGLFFAALNVQYRDVQHLVANALTFIMFLSPILYPVHLVPERFRPLIDFNPFAAITIIYQDILLNGTVPGLLLWGVSVIFALAGVVFGALVFNARREGFAERL